MIHMAIDAETKVVALIGKPVGHSLSPAMHNAAFQQAKLNFVYVAFEVSEQQLGEAIAGTRALGFAGLNVTIPHKIAVLQYLDEVDELARKIGAVNTIVNRKGVLKGYNTDASGAVEALEKRTKLAGKNVLLLGAGGAARAISFALVERGACISVTDIMFEKAKELATALGGCAEAVQHNELAQVAKSANILINASPIGMHPNINAMPIAKSLLNKNMLVFDIVYNPAKTLLLKKAEALGCRTIPGFEMLLNQGAIAFELWTGKRAQLTVMEKALKAGLGIKK